MSATEPTNGHGDATEELPALDDLIDDEETEGASDELGPAPRTDEPARADEPAPRAADPTPSDEQPVVVFGVEDSDDEQPVLGGDDEVLPEPDLPTRGGDGALVEAYSNLEIRTPPEELDAFARGRVDALARVGQAERAALAGEALHLAQAALRRVMGAQPREAP